MPRSRDRLSALDSLFLRLETGAQSLHVGTVLILEGPAPSPERFRHHVAERVASLPILGRRVLQMPLGLGRPIWVDAEGFDASDHVHRARLDEPGSDDQLRAAVARLMAPRLDPRRPLWEVWQVDGLTGGRWAVVAKAHHTMVDGRSGVGLVQALLADAPGRVPAAAPAAQPRPKPSTVQLAVDLPIWAAGLALRTLRLAARSLLAPRSALQKLRAVRFGLGQVIRPDLPPSVLNGPLSAERLWGWATADLAAVQRRARTAGCTVNDVFLAALAGAFRRFLMDRGEDLRTVVLRTIVPVARPDRRWPGAVRNLTSAMFVELPVQLADPAARLAAVRARTAAQKARGVPEATAAFVAMADHIPAPLLARAGTAYGRARQGRVNVAATNLRGPDQTQYLASRRVLAVIPWVPVALDVRATAAMISYAGALTVAVTADARALPDADSLVAAVGEELALLSDD